MLRSRGLGGGGTCRSEPAAGAGDQGLRAAVASAPFVGGGRAETVPPPTHHAAPPPPSLNVKAREAPGSRGEGLRRGLDTDDLPPPPQPPQHKRLRAGPLLGGEQGVGRGCGGGGGRGAQDARARRGGRGGRAHRPRSLQVVPHLQQKGGPRVPLPASGEQRVRRLLHRPGVGPHGGGRLRATPTAELRPPPPAAPPPRVATSSPPWPKRRRRRRGGRGRRRRRSRWTCSTSRTQQAKNTHGVFKPGAFSYRITGSASCARVC